MAMVLKKTGAEVQTAAGGFEGEEVTQAAVVEKAAESTVSEQAKADVKATTAIARAATGTAVTTPGKFGSLLKELENAIPKLDFGVLPRIVASNGGQFQDKGSNTLLGDEIHVQLISYNDEYVISPGDKAADATEKVRYSDDGKVLSDGSGRTVAEYLEYLTKSEQYEKANVKQYKQLICILQSAKKAGKEVQTDLVNQMVLVSCSPQSRKSFEGYLLQESVKAAMGKRSAEGAENLVLRTDTKTKGTDSYCVIKVSAE
jgi:hypothetical protein